jgi:hypothetical protein
LTAGGVGVGGDDEVVMAVVVACPKRQGRRKTPGPLHSEYRQAFAVVSVQYLDHQTVANLQNKPPQLPLDLCVQIGSWKEAAEVVPARLLDVPPAAPVVDTRCLNRGHN